MRDQQPANYPPAVVFEVSWRFQAFGSVFVSGMVQRGFTACVREVMRQVQGMCKASEPFVQWSL